MTIKKTATVAKRSSVKKALSPTKQVKKSATSAALKSVAKKTKKVQKVKVVRDSFTMPQNEYQKIGEIKAACLKAKMHVKKSEILRAGLKLLAESNAAKLKLVLGSLEKIKTGRPKKH